MNEHKWHEIGRAMRLLEKERRDAVRAAMSNFDKMYYNPKRAELQLACAEVGHNWQFTHAGPLGDPWFSCTVCHLSECRRDEA